MNFKSLLFGSAAIMAVGTGAQAADLPVVEPVEYVRICDAFGTGFYYIPGTETCLRISGRVRVETHYVDGPDDDELPNFIGSNQDEDFNNWTTRARGNLRFDARTQTDFGLVRAFANFQLTIGPSDFANNYSSTGTDLDQAYIQISRERVTFTAGHVDSFFDSPYSSNTFGTRVGIDDPTTSQTLFGVTFSSGGPLSFSISAEDPASSGRRFSGDDELVLPGPDGLLGTPDDIIIFEDDGYEGQEYPDGVANVRWDGGWGTLFASGVVRGIHDNDPNSSGGDGIGWATNIGIVADLGMFNFGATAGYADGAIGYITNDPGGVGDYSSDADDTNSAWSVRAGIGADFSPTLSGFLDASYTDIDDENDTLGTSVGDYSFWSVAANLVYSPVSGLIMGPEIAYSSSDDIDVFNGSDDVWGVMFRIQRDF